MRSEPRLSPAGLAQTIRQILRNPTDDNLRRGIGNLYIDCTHEEYGDCLRLQCPFAIQGSRCFLSSYELDMFLADAEEEGCGIEENRLADFLLELCKRLAAWDVSSASVRKRLYRRYNR